jgi:hypothetical protein
MANPEHLAKLKEGVEAWNKWRKDNPEIKRDLTEIDLRKADLGYASLTGAGLERANLTETNLEGANFTGAGNLEVEQLCQAKTLYKGQLDLDLACTKLLESLSFILNSLYSILSLPIIAKIPDNIKLRIY